MSRVPGFSVKHFSIKILIMKYKKNFSQHKNSFVETATIETEMPLQIKSLIFP